MVRENVLNCNILNTIRREPGLQSANLEIDTKGARCATATFKTIISGQKLGSEAGNSSIHSDYIHNRVVSPR